MQMNKNLPALIIGIVALVAVVAGVVLYNNGKAPATSANKTNVNSASSGDKIKNAPPGATPAWTRGAPNAPVVLEEFGDFQCPSCAAFEPTMREIKTIYADKVRVVFRQYPLAMHPKAYDAALAAEAAGMQGADKFWAMHDLLYEKQKDWTVMEDHRKTFADYAKTLGLDVNKFNEDLVGLPAKNRVSADKQRGDFIPIKATPSLFLNNRLLLPEEMQTAKLRELIDKALAGK
jgi:protein-disulfide isomerase